MKLFVPRPHVTEMKLLLRSAAKLQWGSIRSLAAPADVLQSWLGMSRRLCILCTDWKVGKLTEIGVVLVVFMFKSQCRTPQAANCFSLYFPASKAFQHVQFLLSWWTALTVGLEELLFHTGDPASSSVKRMAPYSWAERSQQQKLPSFRWWCTSFHASEKKSRQYSWTVFKSFRKTHPSHTQLPLLFRCDVGSATSRQLEAACLQIYWL